MTMEMNLQYSKFVPKHGSVDNLFDRLRLYIDEVDKTWIHSIKPSAQDSIELLKQYSRIEEKSFDIPKAYRIFLEYMGEEDGGFLSRYLLANTSLTIINELYKEVQEIEPKSINPNILVFALFDVSDELAIELNHSDEPKIVRSIGGEIRDDYAESFEKLLFQAAFTKYEKMRFPFYDSYGGFQATLKNALKIHQTEDIFEVVDEISKKEHFTKVWFSDFRRYIGFRDDAAFKVTKGRGTVTLALYGTKENFIENFGEKLSINIGSTK